MHNLSFWEAFAVNTFAVVLRQFVKNPTKYATIRNTLREIADEINSAFPPDTPATTVLDSVAGR